MGIRGGGRPKLSHSTSSLPQITPVSELFHKPARLCHPEAHPRAIGVTGSPDAAALPKPRYFTQDVDHFDGSNADTWQQAYYVNDTFWAGAASKAPVFVCVGGEGPPLDGSVVVASVHCNIAVEWLQETGALMVALEHRFYGCHNKSACPVSSFLPADALKHLSSRQALSDLASFHQHITEEYSLTSSNKWVSWGGSYPGMLAGWFRLRFPHLVHASVASSAPVQAELDMRGYNDVSHSLAGCIRLQLTCRVARLAAQATASHVCWCAGCFGSECRLLDGQVEGPPLLILLSPPLQVVASAYAVTDNNVGGSPNCSEAIRVGHASIGKLFTTDAGRSRLATLFGRTATWYGGWLGWRNGGRQLRVSVVHSQRSLFHAAPGTRTRATRPTLPATEWRIFQRRATIPAVPSRPATLGESALS